MSGRRLPLALALLAAAVTAACAPTPIAAPVYDITPDEPVARAAPAPAPVVTPPVYEVVSGDTLVGIAMHYDIDYRELARWNNLRDPNLIQPGQRLRMTPPANDPVTGTVVKQQAPLLQPAQPTETAAASSAPAAGVQRQSTVIGGTAAASPAPAAGTAPYKTGPQAIKYAYSKGLLQKLQREWQQRKPAAARPATPAPKPAAAPAPKPAAPAPQQTAAATAPKATRQRYGIQWGKPSGGAMVKKYSDISKGAGFAGARGDPVYAAADGVVIYVGTGVKSYGRLVILRHSNNYLSAYAHNDKVLVKEDARVRRGGQIATMGDSGSDRVMLHFEVRRDGKPIDPAQVLPK